MKRPKQKMFKNPQIRNGLMALPGVSDFNSNPIHHPHCPSSESPMYLFDCFSKIITANFSIHSNLRRSESKKHEQDANGLYPLTVDALRAIDAVDFITDHLKMVEEHKMHREDWKYTGNN